MKTAGFRIRVEPELRDAFVNSCRTHDISAAQVLRAYMRYYVQEHAREMQGDLFDELLVAGPASGDSSSISLT
jgi:hypothetical protein